MLGQQVEAQQGCALGADGRLGDRVGDRDLFIVCGTQDAEGEKE